MPKGVYIRTKPPWNKGIPWSEEIKIKIGAPKKGKYKGAGNPFFGKHHSEETRKKWSEKRKGKKWSNGNTGMKMSVEQRKKMSERSKGKNNPAWKGGKTSENHLIRYGIEANLWREASFARDGFICQKCSQWGGKLIVHHINNFAQFPELRFAIDNGITFCKKCHIEFHKKYGYKDNNKEQIEEYVN